MPSPLPTRARRAEDKQRRRTQILVAADGLFAERSYADIKMAEIAREAGVAKGTVFLYFPTKEALFLELLSGVLGDWLAEFEDGLASGRGPWSGARVARVLVETLAPRASLTRLLALLSSVLERNVDVAQLTEFKLALRDRLATTGELLERRLEFLGAGEGARLMLQIHAVVVGVHQMANSGPVAREVLAKPELVPLAVDFEVELKAMLLALLAGREALA